MQASLIRGRKFDLIQKWYEVWIVKGQKFEMMDMAVLKGQWLQAPIVSILCLKGHLSTSQRCLYSRPNQ